MKEGKAKKQKKIKIKKITREQQVEALKEQARAFTFSYNPVIVDLTLNSEECRQATERACWRPDIFLNNDRSCNNCSLFEHCACASKRLIKRKNDTR